MDATTQKEASPNRVLGLIVTTALLTMVVICGGVMFKEYSRQQVNEQAKTAAFEQWVAWRGEHCRFEGSLGNGTFVCDNGGRYKAASGRYGEYKKFPRFVNGQPELHYVGRK